MFYRRRILALFLVLKRKEESSSEDHEYTIQFKEMKEKLMLLVELQKRRYLPQNSKKQVYL